MQSPKAPMEIFHRCTLVLKRDISELGVYFSERTETSWLYLTCSFSQKGKYWREKSRGKPVSAYRFLDQVHCCWWPVWYKWHKSHLSGHCWVLQISWKMRERGSKLQCYKTISSFSDVYFLEEEKHNSCFHSFCSAVSSCMQEQHIWWCVIMVQLHML